MHLTHSKSHTIRYIRVFLLIALFGLLACSDEPSPASNPSEVPSQGESSNSVESAKRVIENKSESITKLGTKDSDSSHQLQRASARSWSQILSSKKLRVLKLEREEESALPRAGSSSLYHFDLIKRFAKKHNLEIEWISAKTLSEMFEDLETYYADVIPRNLTVTDSRKSRFNFTKPIHKGQEVLIGRANAKPIKPNDVYKVSVPKQTAYVDSIKASHPHWHIDLLDESLNADEIANAIVEEKIDYSILDQRDFEILLSYRKDVKKLATLDGDKYLAWAVARNNPTLLEKLNQFITYSHASRAQQKLRTHDLTIIKQNRQALRMITRNSPETYFLWRGDLMGFEYELMKKFAQEQDLRLEVIVADSLEEMTQLLSAGKGDLIAAGLSRTQERQTSLANEFVFSSRYNRVDELLVANTSGAPIAHESDLAGRTIGIRKSSAFRETAERLAKTYGVAIDYLDEELSTELIIDRVANKQLDLTIADSNLVSIEKRFRENIDTPLKFKESIPYAYTLRKGNPRLLASLNQFIKKYYRGTFYNVVKNKYFGSTKRQKSHRLNRVLPGNSLSPFDEIVKKDALEFQFDWRMITAQMYQESRFDPQAKSNAGALGLMQVLPRTAKELGYEDLVNPNQAIAAGIKYLDWTRKRFLNRIPVQERIFFALAAYNAGFGHVRDAQVLAKQQGLNPNKWFDNVEKAILLLQQPKYYKKSRFGYCRGSEPVEYVRSIQQRYLTYSKIIK